MTDNHGYNTPPEGATDWHIPLNENFDRIDTDVEIRGPESERGNYAPKSNAKYVATDTGAVFLGDGSTWYHVGDIKRLDGNVYVQGTEPSSPQKNDIWVDTN